MTARRRQREQDDVEQRQAPTSDGGDDGKENLFARDSELEEMLARDDEWLSELQGRC